MKKVVTILAVIFCTIVFNSCTDDSLETNEIIYNENGTQLIDKGELGTDKEDEEEGNS